MRDHVEDEIVGLALERRGKEMRAVFRPQNLCLETLVKAEGAPANRGWTSPEMIVAAERIVDCICRTYASHKLRPGQFVSIPRRKLMDLCGRSKDAKRTWLYPNVIAMLALLGVVEVNDRYSTGVGGRAGFSKSFRLSRPYWTNKFEMGVQWVASKASQRQDRSKPKDEIQRAAAVNLAQMRIDWDALRAIVNRPELESERRIRILEDANKIERGLVDLSAGKKQRRLYHVLNRAAKQAREALRYNGERLVELDVKSCQPVLLLTLCPAEEREGYIEVLRADIYSLGGSSREAAKAEFARFAFGKYRRRNAFGEEFTGLFPKFADTIRNFGGSLSAHLQDIEAAVCVYQIGARLLDEGIFWAGIHDAFLVLPRDAATVAQIIKEEFARLVPDFQVEVRGRPEATGISHSLIATASFQRAWRFE